MALKKHSELNNTAENIPQSVKFPRARYTARCRKEEFGVSKGSGNPMITREWEIVLPETINIDGKNYTVAGTVVKQYLTLETPGDATKSDKQIVRFMDDLKKLGCPNWDEVDTENPPLFAEGKVAQIICDSDEYSPMEAQSDEQKAAGEKPQPITMEDGTPIKRYRPVFKELLALSSLVINETYA